MLTFRKSTQKTFKVNNSVEKTTTVDYLRHNTTIPKETKIEHLFTSKPQFFYVMVLLTLLF